MFRPSQCLVKTLFFCRKFFWQKFSSIQFGFLCCLPTPQQDFLIFIFIFFLSDYSFSPLKKLLFFSHWWDCMHDWATSETICFAGPTCHFWIILFFPSRRCSKVNYASSWSSSILKLSCQNGMNVAAINQGSTSRFPICKMSRYLVTSLTHVQSMHSSQTHG